MKKNIIIVDCGGIGVGRLSLLKQIAEEQGCIIVVASDKETPQELNPFAPEPIIIKALPTLQEYKIYPLDETPNKYFGKPKNNFKR